MPDVVISEPIHPAALARLTAVYDVMYDRTLYNREAALRAALLTARALIVRNLTPVWRGLIQPATRLRVVAHLGIDTDNVDLSACAERDVVVMAAVEANDVAVAQYVLAGLMLTLRPAFLASDSVAWGGWPRYGSMGAEPTGKTLALIGYGATAAATARLAGNLGMRVVVWPQDEAARLRLAADDGEAVAFDQALSMADAVSLHLPLTPQTRHIVDGRALALLPPQAVLINAARGALVDEAALIAALRAERLGGAVLDVFEVEPLPADNGFRDLRNVLLTPHIAGLTEEAFRRAGDAAVDAVVRALG
jgi:(S)-sulfolactate dehydrogenase